MRGRRPSPASAPLPISELLKEVTADYLAFLRRGPGPEEEDAKAFAARHAAARAALTHLEALLKLGEAASQAEPPPDAEALLHAARDALHREAPDGKEPPEDACPC